MLCGSGRVSVASCGMASPPHEHIPGHNILVHAGRNARLKSGAETPFFNPTPSARRDFRPTRDEQELILTVLPFSP
jgi:hypothetical protein